MIISSFLHIIRYEKSDIMKLGILFGGNSQEHEISIVSAYQVKQKLEKSYIINMIYIDFNNNLYNANKMSLDDFKNNNYKKLKKTCFIDKGVKGLEIDCMILAVHGENCEDGIASALCRYYHIPYVGSDILASSIALDKYRSYCYLANNGINMIDSILYTFNDYIAGKLSDVYPCIIKPLYGGSSIGIAVCNNEDEFIGCVKKAFKYCDKVVIQKYYDNIKEYNLAVYENGVSKLEGIELKHKFFTFEDKYASEFKMMHKGMSDDSLYSRFVDVGRRVYNLLAASGIVRIDFFMIDDNIYVNEVNIIPGGLAMYLFDDFNRVIAECIDLAIRKRNVIYKRGSFLAKSNINK